MVAVSPYADAAKGWFTFLVGAMVAAAIFEVLEDPLEDRDVPVFQFGCFLWPLFPRQNRSTNSCR